MTSGDIDSNIREAVRLLQQGGLIAFPTETYYGLAVDPFNREALNRLFSIKKRTKDKAVLVLIDQLSQLNQLVSSVPAGFDTLMTRFWPGPLTLVFPARKSLPSQLTGGTGSIGIRQSPNSTAAALLRRFGGPVTATSANRSGAEPASTAAEVEAIFASEVDLVLDGGATPGGQGSTLVGFDQGIYCIRPGRIAFSVIEESL